MAALQVHFIAAVYFLAAFASAAGVALVAIQRQSLSGASALIPPLILAWITYRFLQGSSSARKALSLFAILGTISGAAVSFYQVSFWSLGSILLQALCAYLLLSSQTLIVELERRAMQAEERSALDKEWLENAEKEELERKAEREAQKSS